MQEIVNAKPRIAVIGIGGAGGNAVNNMIASGLNGVKFIVANTDKQALAASRAEHKIQLGTILTDGLGAGSKPEVGELAAEEALEEIAAQISDAHMLFIAAGMGGGTGTGATYVVARAAREFGILTVAVVTKPFQFEGAQRMQNAESGIAALAPHIDTLLVIPNENLFQVATDRTTFAEAFLVADQVLYSGIACLVNLIVEEGLINLDLADVRTVLSGMGTAMLGTGEASGERRAISAAEEAIVNPLLDNVTLKGARNLLISISGGYDLTLWEVDEAANRVRQEVDPDANIIVGTTLDQSLADKVSVSIIASGIPNRSTGERTDEACVPTWLPRYLRTGHGVVGADPIGHRLTEAIAERTRGKPKRNSKSRGRNRNGAADAATLRDSSPKPSNDRPSGRRAKRDKPGAAHDWASIEFTKAKHRQPWSAAPDSTAPMGWPEHWASAGEASSVEQRYPVAPAEEGLVDTQEVEQPPRKGTLLGRLASLIGAKRDG